MSQAPDVATLVQQIRELTKYTEEMNHMVRSRKSAMLLMVTTPEGQKSAQVAADLLNAIYPEMSRALAAMGPARAAINRLVKQAKRTGFRA